MPPSSQTINSQVKGLSLISNTQTILIIMIYLINSLNDDFQFLKYRFYHHIINPINILFPESTGNKALNFSHKQIIVAHLFDIVSQSIILLNIKQNILIFPYFWLKFRYTYNMVLMLQAFQKIGQTIILYTCQFQMKSRLVYYQLLFCYRGNLCQ